jgi:hypothetical protein
VRRFLKGNSSSPTAFLTKDRRTETMMAASRVSADIVSGCSSEAGIEIPLKMMKKMGTEKTSAVMLQKDERCQSGRR